MPNANIYLHEIIDIIGQNRARYMEHMLGFAPTAREERKMLNVGVWATVGSTERWPQSVNLWELPGWKAVAANFDHELSHPTRQDPSLIPWWAKAAEYRSGGYDRLLIPAPYSPTLRELIERGVKGPCYYHETVQVAPGQARTYLGMLEQHYMPIAQRLGMELVGAYRTSMVNDSEVIVLWVLQSFAAWAALETANEEDAELARWRALTRNLALDWRNKLLFPAEGHPLTLGRVL